MKGRETMGARTMLDLTTWSVHVLLLLHSLWLCQGKIYMNVSPYPARVYKNAPAGVAVLTVQAYDNATGEAISNFRLDPSDYFSINSSGIVSTARQIDRVKGFKFTFFVLAMGTAGGSPQWKHVIVEVGEKNLYAPQFSQATYNFSVYRYAAPGTHIGTVIARDSDSDPYNRHFTIYAPPRQSSADYVNVTSVGDVVLARAPPDGVGVLEVGVLGVDNGSPQRTGTTTVLVIVEDVNQPSTFCLATTDSDTTLCWKNPMPGRRHQGYNVVVQGQGLVLHKHIRGDKDAEEFCVSTSDLQLGHNYTFRVTLDDDDNSAPPGVELTFHKLGQGYSRDCTEHNFNACHFLSPCHHGATCLAGDGAGLDYSCQCPTGWQGQNCTQVDLCPAQPCHNQGTCVFTGHERYRCQCPPEYLGPTCKTFDHCAAANPCQHGGACRMYDNGTYSCACADYFSGTNCTVPDPCSPSPCGNRGDCIKMSNTAATCVCFPGYQGDHCDVVDVCESARPCTHGGTCTTATNGSFVCTCPPDYTGMRCEVYNTCTLACQNNATCGLSEDGGYHCYCPPSYHGFECQYYNRCHGDPCMHGTCNTDDSLPLCDCDPGFHGTVCEEHSVCRSKPCGEQGDCVPLPAGLQQEGSPPYRCECHDGWWGPSCQFPDLCRRSRVCQNGALCHNIAPDSYRCDCVDGHYGDQCQHHNPCSSSPCLHGGHCHNHTDARYTCTCLPPYSSPRCQHATSCNFLPCANGGSCVLHDDGRVHCACVEGFLGYHCQLRDPCLGGDGEGGEGGEGSVCGHGWCERDLQAAQALQPLAEEVGEVEVPFRCHCDQGYSGKRCDVAVTSCDGSDCFNNGQCRHGRCVCPPAFTGSQCQTAVSLCGAEDCGEGRRCLSMGSTHICVCDNDRLHDCVPVCRSEEMVPEKTGRFVWPETAVGYSAELPCPYEPRPNQTDSASRPCLPSPGLGAVWGEVEADQCNELGLLEASRRLNALKELTSEPSNVGSSDVNNYTSILEELFDYTLMDPEVASLMMNVISNLADVNVSVTVASDVESNTSQRLLNLLERYTADVNLTSGGNVSIKTRNFEVMAVGLEDTSSGVTYTPSVTSSGLTYTPSVRSHNSSTEELNITITIPPEVFTAQHRREVTSKRKSGVMTPTAVRLQVAGHRKCQLFLARGGGQYSDGAMAQRPVISARVAGRRVSGLTNPVVYTVRNWQTRSNYTCVFWNPRNRSWSAQGVRTAVKSGNFTVCHSTHLTSFAVLLDASPHYVLSATHEAVLSYISYIGCAVSLLCLLLTLLTYALFRSLNKDKSGKILLNLCVALLLLNAVFLAGALASSDDHDNDNDGNGDDNDKGLKGDVSACRAVAVLLHYLLLASLTWMLVEAMEMYRALVTVFAKYAQCYMIKRCLLGWGLPVVIVAITLGVDQDNYDTDGAFCFLSRAMPAAYYGALLGPACLVLLVNTVIFILVTRVILKPRFQQQKQKGSEGITPAQVRGAFTVMFLLGVTWVFGPLAIREAKVVFNYLFCILNSLQGFLIFVFRCLFNPEVRMCWVQLLKTGTLKKRRGPIRSNVYSDTSSKAEGKSGTFHNGSHGTGYSGSNGSTTATTKTSLRTSNGWHPKLNGLQGNQAMQRRGTKFSTLEFSHETPESVKVQQNPLTEDERYGDGNLDSMDDDHNLFPVLDYYETGHDGRAENANTVRYEDFHGDGGVLDYYESIRSSRKEDNSQAAGTREDGDTEAEDGEDDRGPSEASEQRSARLQSDSEGLTCL